MTSSQSVVAQLSSLERLGEHAPLAKQIFYEVSAAYAEWEKFFAFKYAPTSKLMHMKVETVLGFIN